MENSIEIYSTEIGLRTSMTLDELIDSHRILREKNSKKHQDWLSEMNRGREIGIQQGVEMVAHGQYIEVSKLKNLTISELVKFISSQSD